MKDLEEDSVLGDAELGMLLELLVLLLFEFFFFVVEEVGSFLRWALKSGMQADKVMRHPVSVKRRGRVRLFMVFLSIG